MNTLTIQKALKRASMFIPNADPGALDGIRGAKTEAAAKEMLDTLCDWIAGREIMAKSSFTPPRRHVDRVFIHCSASDHEHHDDISVMREWHVKRWPKQGGNPDVGYHYFIKRDGTVQKGRDLERIPIAQKGHNTGTIAICAHGHREFTDSQFDALVKLCKDMKEKLPNCTFHGHKEVSARECPVFDYKEVLNLDKEGNML